MQNWVSRLVYCKTSSFKTTQNYALDLISSHDWSSQKFTYANRSLAAKNEWVKVKGSPLPLPFSILILTLSYMTLDVNNPARY